MEKLLTKKFLAKYPDFPKHMTELGKFIFYRTYSRWLPDLKRRETWKETVSRAVEYNCSLIPGTKRHEAERLFDNIFNLKQALSGRTFWVGGTDVSKKFPMANFNCAFIVIDEFEAIKELFYCLMLGTGVGARILKSDVDKLPRIRQNIMVIHKPYKPVPKHQRTDHTAISFTGNVAELTVGDSKEGWTEALSLFLKMFYDPFYRNIEGIVINYNNVRPKGERLKTFGGRASGHESIKIMFEKIYDVLTTDRFAPKPVDGKLRPIHVLDIITIIGQNVVVGGVRRTALNTLIDESDEETILAKKDLWKTPDKSHRYLSNNSIFYNKKPDLEMLNWQFEVLERDGEPGFMNAEAARKRRPDFEGVNPCFTGDMKLLTKDGYKRFDELAGKQVELINKDGAVSVGKVWCSGEKEVVSIRLGSKETITCTPDHIFMTNENQEVKAKDLKGKRLMPFLHNSNQFNEKFVLLGFAQGDGSLSRIKSKDHLGIEVSIGKKDGEVKELFSKHYQYTESEYKIYVSDMKDDLIKLGFSSNTLPERCFPISYNSWTLEQKASFLRGCYSANGSVINTGRIAYKTTCKHFAEQLVKTLDQDFGITAYITTNKSRKNKFSNGTYTMKESYDINIQRHKDRCDFYNKIGFVQTYKMEKLKEKLIKNSPIVVNVCYTGEVKEVYDFTEPITHWGIVEGHVVHNCFEVLLASRGLCNLTTVNVMAFVKDGKLDKDGLLNAQILSARAAFRMANVELELPKWNEIQKRDRLLGCSLTGWKDAVEALDYSKEQEEELQKQLHDVARIAVDTYAELEHLPKPLLATTIKPEGTISQVFGGVSSGLHHTHAPFYIRRVRINANDPLCKVAESLGWSVKNEVGQGVKDGKGNVIPVDTKVIEFPISAPVKRTKYEVSAIEQLETYLSFQKNYTEHNSSNTVTVKDHEWEEVKQFVYDHWDEIIAVSFLKLDGHSYELAPYEAITEEQYKEMKSKMKPFDPELLIKFEDQGDDFDIGNDGCESGICPVR